MNYEIGDCIWGSERYKTLSKPVRKSTNLSY